jgi:NADH-quinone oxidoreductase subunit B
MLLDAILKLHDKIENMKLGKNREREIEELEQARLSRLPLRTQPLPAQLHLSASSGPAGGDQ